MSRVFVSPLATPFHSLVPIFPIPSRYISIFRAPPPRYFSPSLSMATAWAQTGRVVLRKPATPGYGLEVGGKADNGRLQLRAVALNANRDSQRDRDIETLWCGEFQRLQALLAAQGGELSVERALGVGEVALKEIGEEEQREMVGVARQRGL